MSNIINATIQKEANIYYDGKVTSRTITLENGDVQSLGIMLPGEYTFTTQKAEKMEMMSGDLEIKLENEDWRLLKTPETFFVSANSSFDLKIKSTSDYCCSYLD
jgi:uncharacterized protein YaiE (UPF0345 family)